MNDIYEYKAMKYKYKYLKLKYFAEGGEKGRVTLNKIKNKLGNYNLFSSVKPRDKNKLINNNKPPTQEQKNFKDKLKSLRKSIDDMNDPLLIYGNINYNDIFYNEKGKIEFTDKIKNDKYEQAKLIIDKKTSLKIDKKNESFSIKTYDIKYIYDRIFKDMDDDGNIYTISYLPPILLRFYRIYKRNKSAQEIIWKGMYDNHPNPKWKGKPFNEMNTVVSEKQLLDEFKDLNPHTLDKFKKFFEFFKNKYPEFKRLTWDEKYTMNTLFLFIFSGNIDHTDNFINCIKSINYYSIAMIINDLYDNFNEFFQIVETCTSCTTEKKSQKLPGLFKELKDDYNNHEITRDRFLTKLDEIINTIKDK